ncbi:MAG: 5'-nucleotidase C-terminal domain-containing protein, partial [Bacteroidales bacterium]|nr:5'-nucleotidase C-terminal domain-containing protein [Bacteroidales bacterium]
TVPLYTRESYRGMCDYMNLIHTVQLMATGADVSFAAPLTYDGTINGGKVLYNDLFKIYPYENQLFKVRMTGRQIKDYLEYSYNLWIGGEDGHVLKIHKNPDERTGASGWSFDNRSYNFDSASGLLYHVDVFAPMGERVVIESFADGSDFDPEGSYTVAMTSYRASGGGGTIINGAGIPANELDGIVVDRYPEIRDLIYDFFKSNILVSSELTDDRELLGFWLFTGDGAAERIDADMKLLFD